jgi:hypothetical protein
LVVKNNLAARFPTWHLTLFVSHGAALSIKQ